MYVVFNLGSFRLKNKSISYHSSSQNYHQQRWATYPESLTVTISEHPLCLPTVTYPSTHQSSLYLPAYHLFNISSFISYLSIIYLQICYLYLSAHLPVYLCHHEKDSRGEVLMSKVSYSVSLRPVKSKVSTPPGQCRTWRLGFSLLDSVIHTCFSAYL